MHPVLFHIGKFTIYSYGFFVFLGISISFVLMVRKAPRYGIDKDIVSDLVFWMVLGGFVGARILYILVNWHYFLEDPLGVGLSRAGFVFYGGIFGGLISAFVFLRRKKARIWQMADFIAPYIALAHSFGRIGCFCYGCCYGKPTDSFIGMLFPQSSPAGALGRPVIPTQLISSGFLFFLFLFLSFLYKHNRARKYTFAAYLFIYSVFRFIIEFLRGDERGYWGYFSVSQWISLLVFFVSIHLFLHRRKTT
jgi:phosphatidylglycerol:prolipoprotein diacylglycerol transferase